MSDTEKLDVALAPDMAALVKEAVQSGQYASTSEVIAEALLEWQINRSAPVLDDDELRRLVEEGLASGPGRESSIEDIKKEARRRAEAKKAAE